MPTSNRFDRIRWFDFATEAFKNNEGFIGKEISDYLNVRGFSKKYSDKLGLYYEEDIELLAYLLGDR